MATDNPSQSIGRAFLANAAHNLDHCIGRINHCVGQLTDEQVWWRPQEGMNSIGNLLLHLGGNMQQWIVNGVSQKPDTRDRPREFAERGPIAKAELLKKLDQTAREVRAVMTGWPENRLTEPRRIQKFEETVLSAIAHSINHLAGHTQEIIHMTRSQLGDEYRFAWQPTTPEEGA